MKKKQSFVMKLLKKWTFLTLLCTFGILHVGNCTSTNNLHRISRSIQQNMASSQWDSWGEWECSKKCGLSGKRKRNRVCKLTAMSKPCNGTSQKVDSKQCYVTMCQRNVSQIYSFDKVGCFKGNDNNNRLVSTLVDSFRGSLLWTKASYKQSMASTVLRCALTVQNEPSKYAYEYFGIEYYGECWAANITSQSLQTYPKSDTCVETTPGVYVGPEHAIFVYKFRPVNGTWGEWGQWSSCSKTCGDGTITRTRNCSKARWGGAACHGPSTERSVCNIKCPEIDQSTWNTWQIWGSCSKPCGRGKMTRHRSCATPQRCDGPSQESRSCYLNMCKEQASSILPFQRVGCYNHTASTRLLPKLITADFRQDNLWYTSDSLAAVVLRCAAEIQNKHSQYVYFGIEFYGECWAGIYDNATIEKQQTYPELCYEAKFNYSVGKVYSVYIYKFLPECCKLVNGIWSAWQPWSSCSSLCSKGTKTRTRSCSPPLWGGHYCLEQNKSVAECQGTTCLGFSSFVKSEAFRISAGGVFLLILALLAILLIVRRRRRLLKSVIITSDQWEITGEQLEFLEVLGQGEFGMVYKGIFTATASKKKTFKTPASQLRRTFKRKVEVKLGKIVAIKQLHESASDEQKKDFLDEIKLMKFIGVHTNIVNMLGCRTTIEPLYLVVELVRFGDLLNFLRNRREQILTILKESQTSSYSMYYDTMVAKTNYSRLEDADTQPSEKKRKESRPRCVAISYRRAGSDDDEDHVDIIVNNNNSTIDDDMLHPCDLLAFSWQIAKGMEYLSAKKIIHRDLAARNILVGENKIVKVADFGLSRNVYDDSIYCTQKRRKLPIKWMSPESLYDQVFTASSDVWAYGIVLWEILTLGGNPYPTINNHRILKMLKSGYRLNKPDFCTDEMYDVMRKCWKDQPDERPSFSEIRYTLEQLMLEENPYLELYDEIGAASYQFPRVDADGSDDEFDLGDIHLTVDRQKTVASQNGLTTYL